MKTNVGRDIKFLSRQSEQLSNIEMKNLNGNWICEQKVPKKVDLGTLQTHQSHKYQKTKHKNSTFTLTLKGIYCYCKIS
jgi:hypothetical protein